MNSMVEKAENAAEKVMGHRFRHGCVIEKNGKVISTGFNKKVNHPILLSFGYKNKLSNSKPCSCCLKFMIAAGISEVSYSTKSGTIEKKTIGKNG